MLELVVVLHFIVWDADTGKQLWSMDQTLVPGTLSDPIETCRSAGVAFAKRSTARFRAQGYPNAFTNVDCQWERKKETL